MVILNESTCIGCGQCVKDCVMNNIVLENGKAKIENNCIYCGHCVAVCPTDSYTIPEYDMEDVEEYDLESFRINPEHYLHSVKYRRSIRDFKHRSIDNSLLERIIQAGRYTATGSNSQAVSYIIVQEKLKETKELVWEGWKTFVETNMKDNEQMYKIFMGFYETYKEDNNKDRLFFNAPVMVLITADSVLNGGLAATNIENMAIAEGLGVLYDGFIQYAILHNNEAKEYLGIGDKEIAACMLLGYPNITYRRTAPRKKADITWM